MHFVSRAEQPALLAPGGPVERSSTSSRAHDGLAQLRQARNLRGFFLIAREFVADAGALPDPSPAAASPPGRARWGG